MGGFKLDDGKSFDANWDAFLTVMQDLDAEMAAIFRAHEAKLRATVNRGQRDAQARATFNAAILAELDRLLAKKQ